MAAGTKRNQTKDGAGSYTAEHIEVLEGLEAVRKRPGMYIGGTGSGGLTHLLWEIIDNGVDEAAAGHAKIVEVIFHPDGSYNSKKGAGGATDSGEVDGSGYDIVVTNNSAVEGLNMFAGYSKISSTDHAGLQALGDEEQMAAGATYAVGGFTLGYQQSWNGGETTYDNSAYGVSFAVNDNLSISYGKHESTQRADGGDTKVDLEGKSLQASYTMGGASIVIAETEVDNKQYATAAANQREGRAIALTLAF